MPTGKSTVDANPYLFVVGAARSGTTLLQRMLDAHHDLAVVNETYWVPRKYRERNGLTRTGLVTPALVDLLLESPKFDRMGISREDLVRLVPTDSSVQYGPYVSQLFDLFASRRGKRLAGDKTPGYVRRMGQLHELFPAAKFVHIIRDPRDVCVSMLDWKNGESTVGQFGTWADDPVVSTALYWRLSVCRGRQDGASIGPARYFELRYEELVSRPEDVLTGVCRFLGVPYDAQMVRFYEGKTRIKAGRSTKAQWLPPTPGIRNWALDLDRGDVERIEVATGDLMLLCGYDRETCADDEDGALRSRVAAIKQTFAHEVVGSGKSLPSLW